MIKQIDAEEKRREVDEADIQRLFGLDPWFRLAEAKVVDTGHGLKLSVVFRRILGHSMVSMAVLLDEAVTVKDIAALLPGPAL